MRRQPAFCPPATQQKRRDWRGARLPSHGTGSQRGALRAGSAAASDEQPQSEGLGDRDLAVGREDAGQADF